MEIKRNMNAISTKNRFKIWNGEHMIFPENLYNMDLVYNRIGGWTLWDTSKKPHKLLAGEFDNPKLKLLQYTGLHDDFDKTLIWEGDLVEYYDIEKGIGVIVYDAPTFKMKSLEDGCVWDISNLRLKVVGNKFRDLEKLNESQKKNIK